MTGSLHVFGIRHHGPGSARTLARALDALQPDCVVIEGPGELDRVASCAASPLMQPPVAALVYAPEQLRRATFYPMASFSPEWIALRWALAHEVAVRFADLAATHFLAMEGAEEDTADDRRATTRDDPFAALARAAGHDDAERWWDETIELPHHDIEAFALITETMRALRDDAPADPGNDRREAAMREVLRAATADHETVVMVCGAWHAPALERDAWPARTADRARLTGLPKVKAAATWVPYTSPRLARASGYGAGVASPRWYDLLFRRPDPVVRFVLAAARLLRAEGLDAPPAACIDTVRLAELLGVIRGRPLAGLSELLDAVESVLCGGSPATSALIGPDLLVGDDVGRVPPDAPMVPIAADLARLQKRLRMAPTAKRQLLQLDLRNATHRERSFLLHRLARLDVPWGHPADPGRTKGTFRETWSVAWEPELSVALIEAAVLGTTVLDAATQRVREDAAKADDLPTLTALVEGSLLANLPDALHEVMTALDERSAHQHDVVALMQALAPLARVRRYGDVRGSDAPAVHRVLTGMVARVAAGLPAACASLDDDAAALMRDAIDTAQGGLALLDDDALRSEWLDALAVVAGQRAVHGLVAGRAQRLLLDAERLDTEAARRALARALSHGDGPHGAAFVEGFLAGDATLLLHDPELLGVVDGWLRDLPADAFDALLPLVRRTFAGFTPSERRNLGAQVDHLAVGDDRPFTHRHGDTNGDTNGDAGGDDDVDLELAALGVAGLAAVTGLPGPVLAPAPAPAPGPVPDGIGVGS